MAKIDFKQPKYILPLIVLPFLAAINFAFSKFVPKDEGKAMTVTAGINSEIPEPMLENKKEKSKLEAFRDDLLEKRKHSNTRVVGEEEDQKVISEVISPEEQRKIDSLQAVIKKRRASYDVRNKERAVNRKTKISRPSRKTTTAPKVSAKDLQQAEKDAFIEQMRIIDSIQNPEKYLAMNKANTEINAKPNVQKLSLNRSDNNGYFNTVKKNNEDTQIMALLDEGMKVYDGSRVRIRLLQDTFIDDYLLKKGRYVYGEVSGFQSQRVEVRINSIMVADSIVPVKIALYDNDGIRGLYVPDSQFRVFVSELGVGAASDGGTMSSGMGQNSQNNTQQLYRTVSNGIRNASRAVSRAISKNKAYLKYNTQVFLINE
tara:strand:+ start:37455 stop:38573 length:1119 start_codon:yes stop_codon:yes gene_type:complete